MESSTVPLPKRLMIISNRLPIVLDKSEGKVKIIPGSGGLVTALEPVLRNRGGVWIGWPGFCDDQEDMRRQLEGLKKDFTYAPVFLSKEEEDLFYHGFSNEIIWPLFHDLHSQCNFLPQYWKAYQAVNDKYAEEIKRNFQSEDFIWVHDYQLMCVAQGLHEIGLKAPICFFLHIPFPPLDIFLKLPWRVQILKALLEYDLLGFQTLRDRRNFMQCVKALIKEAHFKVEKGLQICKTGDRIVRLGSFPIGIDFKEFNRLASSKEVTQYGKEHKKSLQDPKIILSVDRLDYTKGILLRLKTIHHFLKTYPEMHQKVIFLHVLIPSRVDIPEYQQLKKEIDELVGKINSEFTKLDWVPIHYMFHSLSKTELVAYYRFSDVALVSSVKDGMNLVAKEYVACNVGQDGVLVLSEFTGASAQLHEYSLMINPFDVEGTADVLYKAILLGPEQRREKMNGLRKGVRRHDVYWWVKSFLRAAIANDLSEFPLIKEYVTPQ